VQGLADAFILMRYPFESEEAKKLNSEIFETIYFAALTASKDLAKVDGAYETYPGSPVSKGIFQHDMWEVEPLYKDEWAKLKESVIKYGTRNSLLTALMPTANTSQILGNNECFEFFTNNIYSRKTSAGEFPLVNKYLVHDLINIGMWDNNIKDMILAASGSIQNIDSIPLQFKQLYKTIWEIKQVWVLKAAKARGAFVDQTQSMNIFMSEPDYQRLGSSHFWAWRNGLKTGMYYLRSKPSVDAIKFTIDPKLVKTNVEQTCDSCSA
jgi:ribonucleoside-diphosphate reductase alpha chain